MGFRVKGWGMGHCKSLDVGQIERSPGMRQEDRESNNAVPSAYEVKGMKRVKSRNHQEPCLVMSSYTTKGRLSINIHTYNRKQIREQAKKKEMINKFEMILLTLHLMSVLLPFLSFLERNIYTILLLPLILDMFLACCLLIIGPLDPYHLYV